MRVKRAFQETLPAHRLPEKMDAATRAFGARHNIAISEVPVVLNDLRFSVFDLRWSMARAHVMAAAGDVIVIDGMTRVLSEDEFKLQYLIDGDSDESHRDV